MVEYEKDSKGINLAYVKNNEIVEILLAEKLVIKSREVLNKRNIYFIDVLIVDKDKSKFRYSNRNVQLFKTNGALKDEVFSIELNVYSFNKKTIKFYEKMGMKPLRINYEDVLKK